ncbi:hypothetical protein CCR75_006907 [Bremia lactucae]|uniref:Uncharacterized protein n=1 Tax=Bremia lactucae TaxID=4779 RepID=A0A976NXW2_BRELC|nr:hypothetical protein CCR75_006907 [Bremia lactucae]
MTGCDGAPIAPTPVSFDMAPKESGCLQRWFKVDRWPTKGTKTSTPGSWDPRNSPSADCADRGHAAKCDDYERLMGAN